MESLLSRFALPQILVTPSFGLVILRPNGVLTYIPTLADPIPIQLPLPATSIYGGVYEHLYIILTDGALYAFSIHSDLTRVNLDHPMVKVATGAQVHCLTSAGLVYQLTELVIDDDENEEDVFYFDSPRKVELSQPVIDISGCWDATVLLQENRIVRVIGEDGEPSRVELPYGGSLASIYRNGRYTYTLTEDGKVLYHQAGDLQWTLERELQGEVVKINNTNVYLGLYFITKTGEIYWKHYTTGDRMELELHIPYRVVDVVRDDTSLYCVTEEGEIYHRVDGSEVSRLID